MRYIFYLGNSYECPICEGTFRKFLTYKGNYTLKGVKIDHTTKNYYCPKCNSGIRHRLVIGFLKENIGIMEKVNTLLHFAPENSVSKFLNQFKGLIILKEILIQRRLKMQLN